MRFDGKRIVVTGAGSGIGYQIAKDLFEEGAYVHILGRREDRLVVAKECITRGENSDRITVHGCDVSDESQVKLTFQAIRRDGLIHGLVNNAGIPSRYKAADLPLEYWNKTLATNLTGAFLCSREALIQMLEQGEGSIVNISSVGGLKAFDNRTAYNASKSGLIGLTESMARDYATRSIRVNAVCPGYVRTEMTAKWFDSMKPEDLERLVGAHAMKRIGIPEEISKPVLFLLSDDACWITGVSLPVDGGYMLGRH